MLTHADLASISTKPWNDLVVDANGKAYVNNIGFDFPGGGPAPGLIALVTPGGVVRAVADDLAFPNGMGITEDGATLIVAESYGNRLTAFDISQNGDLDGRRVWADVGDDHPDGICIDTEGAVWYADVANRHCVKVDQSGEALGTVQLDRGAFACTLSRDDDPKLYVVGQEYGGQETAEPTGRVVVSQPPQAAPGGLRSHVIAESVTLSDTLGELALGRAAYKRAKWLVRAISARRPSQQGAACGVP